MSNTTNPARSQEEKEMSEDRTACNVLNEMRLEGTLCDVVIKVDDVEFKAHKNILCGYSTYFKALFTRWSSSDKTEYTIPGVSPDMMDLILQYIYKREIQVTTENVQPLLVAADYLIVRGLFRLCCDFLRAHICPDNCISICRNANKFMCYTLLDRAYIYVLRHFEDIVQSPSSEFLELSLPQLSSILEKDYLNARQEETVFQAVMKWIEHEPNVRSQHIVTLLPKVRLGLMNPEYFLGNVKKSLLVNSYQECQPIITRTLKAMFNINMDGTNTSYLDPLTRPRLPYSILLAVGGFSGTTPTNIIEAYDSRADSWMCISSAEQRPRAYHGTAFLDRFVYTIGGFDGVEYFSTVCRFNPVDFTWQQVAPMHSRRCYVSVVVLDRHIYAMGGFDGFVRLNTAEHYEPKTNQWSLIPSMHEKRSDASATTLKGKIYICGGFDGDECLFTAECFDPHYNQWTLIEPMLMRRSGVGVIALNDQVFAIGGFDGANRLGSSEAYNPLTNSWRMLASMFNPRSNFGIEVMEDCVYVVGGYNGEDTTSHSEYYDEKTDQWLDIKDMHVVRSALSCCVVSGLPNVKDYTFKRDDSGIL